MTSLTTLQFYLIDILYTKHNGQFNLHLIGRNLNDNNRIQLVVNDFYPYFYVKSEMIKHDKVQSIISNSIAINNWLVSSELQPVTKNTYFRSRQISVYRLIGKEPFKVPEIKEQFSSVGIQCFEFDIPFTHRFLIDSGIYCGYVYSIPYNSNQILPNKYIFWKELVKTKKPTTETPYLIAAIDIETGNEEDVSFQELESKKEYKIVAISVCYGFYSDIATINSNCKTFILDNNANEKILLQDFIFFIDELDPDCITTYNGDNFDLPYLEYRLNLYNMEFRLGPADQKLVKSKIDGRYRMAGRTIVDLYPKTWNIHTKTGKKRLVDIAEYFFPKDIQNTKLKIPKLPGSLFNNNQIELLQEYVEQDVKITFKLFHKLLSGEIAIAKINGAPYSDVLLSTQRVNGEFLLMRILVEKNILIPHKPKKNEITIHKQQRKDHPHTGGQVITPKVTTAQNVIIADFVSMYPTLINAKNIGSETFLNEAEYKSEPRSSLALLQERVITQRIKIKSTLKNDSSIDRTIRNALQNQQKALKLVANSMYGATLYVQGRFFDIEVCNSITFMARNLMNTIFDIAKEFGRKNNLNIEVIYSDTDSVFIQVNSSKSQFRNNKEQLSWVKPIQDQLLLHLNSSVPHGMDLTLEDIAKRIIFQKMKEQSLGEEIRKKAYAYYSLLFEKLVIKGFEAIRSDLAIITKKTQEKLFYILLNEKNPERKAHAYLKHVLNRITDTPEKKLLDQVLYSGIIRRAPSKYKSITPAVGAFLNYCKNNNFDPEEYYHEFPRFPYAITNTLGGKANEPLFKKAKHPSIIEKQHLKIDRQFYIQEIIKIAERFELKNPLHTQTSLLDFI